MIPYSELFIKKVTFIVVIANSSRFVELNHINMLTGSTLKYRGIAKKGMLFWAITFLLIGFSAFQSNNNRLLNILFVAYGLIGIIFLFVTTRFFARKIEIRKTYTSFTFTIADSTIPEIEFFLSNIKDYKIKFWGSDQCKITFQLKSEITHTFFLDNKKRFPEQSDLSDIVQLLTESIESYNMSVAKNEVIRRKFSFIATQSGLWLIWIFVILALLVLATLIAEGDVRKGSAALLICIYMISMAIVERNKELNLR